MSQTDSTDRSTREILAVELGRLVEPLATAVETGPEGFERFLNQSGIGEALVGDDAAKLFDQLSQTTVEPLRTVRQELLVEEPSLDAVPPLLDALTTVFQGIADLSELSLDSPDVSEAGDRLLDYLVITYLHDYHPRWYGVLAVTEVVSGYETAAVPELDLTKLGDLLENPNDGIRSLLGWGTDGDFKLFVVLFHLQTLAWSKGIPASFEQPVDGDVARARAPLSTLTASAIKDTLANGERAPLYGVDDTDLLLHYPNYQDEILRIPFLSGPNGSVGVKVVPLPGVGDEHPGLAVFPYGVVSWNEEFDLGADWTASLSGAAKQDDWGISMVPKTDSWEPRFSVVAPDGTVIGGQVNAAADVSYEPSDDSSGADESDGLVLLGDPAASNLTLQSLAAALEFKYEGEEVELVFRMPATGGLSISPQGGFLQAVLPPDLGFDFDAEVGWSNLDGLFFGAGGTLSVSIPSHITLGPLTLREVYLAMSPSESGSITIEAATSPTLSLGPLTASVKRLGISAEISFPERQDGNMGALDVELGFRHPDGIALAVDSGPVTGGGLLRFEPENHRYVGGLELQFSTWGLSAVGLLKTKLPGTDGYSLLVLITADLPPIQLGFGFVLTGIGGLAGVHRGFKKKPLGKAVRSGNLDSVLFPENVVENADQIITDLRAIFPPKADRHVFGPMLRLGWGTPVIIQAELGVLVSLPDWKIALLGKFMVDLPDEEAALIDINLAVVGLLDIPGKRLEIDASLYDSRLVTWTLSGDMAMRLSWGADSRFMLSLGGFHPRYSPPKDFPELERVTASLSPRSGNPRLEYTGYLSVTPNTFQVGAGVVLHGKFGPAVVHGELSFDALFRFRPFGFVVDFFAKVSVRIKGKGLGLKLDGTLSGPQPYRVKGKLSIDILFISVTVKVDATFGSAGGSTELPTANVLPELVRALETPANWSAQKPEGGDQLVTLRDPDAGARKTEGEPERETLLAHPRGTLGVRQQVVPLGVDIEKYGNAKPANTRFLLSKLSVTGVGRDLGGQTALREKFAPAKFRKMSDSEKLESKAFEQLPAGRRVKNDVIHYAGRSDPSLLSWATLDYESSVIDAENENPRTTAADMVDSWDGRLDLSTGHELAEDSAVARGETRTSGPAQYANPEQSLSLSVSEEKFAVAWRETLARLDVDGNPPEGRTRVEAQDRLRAYVANDDDADEADLQVVGVQELANGQGGGSS